MSIEELRDETRNNVKGKIIYLPPLKKHFLIADTTPSEKDKLEFFMTLYNLTDSNPFYHNIPGTSFEIPSTTREPWKFLEDIKDLTPDEAYNLAHYEREQSQLEASAQTQPSCTKVEGLYSNELGQQIPPQEIERLRKTREFNLRTQTKS